MAKAKTAPRLQVRIVHPERRSAAGDAFAFIGGALLGAAAGALAALFLAPTPGEQARQRVWGILGMGDMDSLDGTETTPATAGAQAAAGAMDGAGAGSAATSSTTATVPAVAAPAAAAPAAMGA